MNAPTVTEIMEWSLMDFGANGVDEAALEVQLARATEYVLDVTGQTLASIPSTLLNTANEAIQRTIEQLVMRSQEDQIETAGDFEMIASFGAGGYNESRRGLDEVRKAKVINTWPHLHDLLWRLATDDKREEWEDWWGAGPAFEVTEMIWDDSTYPPDVPGNYGGA